MAQWSVTMFAYLKDRHGEVVRVESEPSVRAVLEALKDYGVDTSSCRLAVNLYFAEPDDALSAGDNLALIPPVSGG